MRKNADTTSIRFNKTFNAHKLPKANKLLPAFAVASFMILMLIEPEYYLESASRGLALFATAVLPSLFPFYFCSLLLTNMGAAKAVSALGRKPVKFLYNSPPEGAYIMILSMLSGYPVGASMTSELYKKGVITQRQAKGIAAYASTSGPIFMLGTVGSAIFHNPYVGIIVLVSHYLGAMINGLIYRPGKCEDSSARLRAPLDSDNLLADTISASTVNMLFVGGYIVLCGMLIDSLSLFGVPELLSSLLGNSAQPITGLLYGLIEMTRGSIECAKCVNIQLGCAITSALIAFGGFSVTLQNYTFLSRCGMKFPEILIRKLTQAAISFVIAFLMGFLL